MSEASTTGPFLKAALFCERVLVEQDNVKSVIRVIDRITHRAVGPDAPEALPTISYSLTLFIALKPGRATGRLPYQIRMNPPSGLQREVASGDFNFSGGPNQGVDMMAQVRLEFDQEGLYWFDLIVDTRLLTRMPLQVLYERIIPGAAANP